MVVWLDRFSAYQDSCPIVKKQFIFHMCNCYLIVITTDFHSSTSNLFLVTTLFVVQTLLYTLEIVVIPFTLTSIADIGNDILFLNIITFYFVRQPDFTASLSSFLTLQQLCDCTDRKNKFLQGKIPSISIPTIFLFYSRKQK